jgi:predicted DNA-binding transcriptional regulator YafY
MATNKKAQLRYRVIDQCLNRKECTFRELKEEVELALSEYNLDSNGISDHQLRMDLKYMESEQGYGAPIVKKIYGRGRYYTYEYPFTLEKSGINEMELKTLEQAVMNLRMFEGRPGFEWLNDLGPFIASKSLKKIQPIISYETNIDYTGNDTIPFLFQAIINEQVLVFDYNPFGKPSRTIVFHPHYLKQHNGRWYIFGRHEGLGAPIWHLPVERMNNIKKHPGVSFVKCTTDWDEYFYDIVGVVRYDEAPQQIKLHVDASTGPYISTKPLHPSQKMKRMENGHYEIRIEIIPNHDFFALILSYGQDIIIKEPILVRQKMKSIIEKMHQNYEQV